MGKIVYTIFGSFAIFGGFAILGASKCQSVSFDGQGSRVAIAQCFADSSGALPAWVAGMGMVLVGSFIIFIGIKR